MPAVGHRVLDERRGLERRRDQHHVDQQLDDRQQRDHQRQPGRFLNAEKIDAGEDRTDGDRAAQHRQRRMQEVEIGPERRGDRRRREQELDRGGIAGDQAPTGPSARYE